MINGLVTLEMQVGCFEVSTFYNEVTGNSQQPDYSQLISNYMRSWL